MSAEEYIYYENSNISEFEYLDFLRKEYGNKAEYRLYKRYKWYNQYLGFHCLLAIIDGKIVGQSCACKVRMMTPNGEIEWWWGCDSFVLKEYRGHGIGKELQKRLFDDHPNFSSLSYSPTNGHIKKKLGAKVLTVTYPSLYPVSRFFSIIFQLIYLKLSGKRVINKSNLPAFPIYRFINKKHLKGLDIKESKFNEENIEFINRCLSEEYDFYIIRDKNYVKWKYDDNPSVDYHLIEIRKDEKLQGVITFSIPYNGMFVLSPVKVCNILDYFISEESNITSKDIINIVSDYYNNQGVSIEGIKGLFKSKYLPTLTYPFKGQELLSKYTGVEFKRPYFSMSDHDLEQIPDLEKL